MRARGHRMHARRDGQITRLHVNALTPDGDGCCSWSNSGEESGSRLPLSLVRLEDRFGVDGVAVHAGWPLGQPAERKELFLPPSRGARRLGCGSNCRGPNVDGNPAPKAFATKDVVWWVSSGLSNDLTN